MIPALMCVGAVAALCTAVFWQRGMAGRHAEMYAASERDARVVQAESDLKVAEAIWEISQVGDDR